MIDLNLRSGKSIWIPYCNILDEVDRSSRATEEKIPDVLGSILRQGAELEIVRDKLKRHAIERIALRDQPILDEHQGEVFRSPLNQQLILLGPPGSGKTTTLIRRLAQKRRPDTLTEDEKSALTAAGLDDFAANEKSWVMFTPTELLKHYLRDAFIEENVPAGQVKNMGKRESSPGSNGFGYSPFWSSAGFSTRRQHSNAGRNF